MPVIRHNKNPFLHGMIIPVHDKKVSISVLGADSNILVNQNTGELHGTHVVAMKKVDSDKFVKTFADYFAFTFDLSKAGQKALRVLMFAVQEQALGKDLVILDRVTLDAFLEVHDFEAVALSMPTFSRGLAELEAAKIIAKAARIGSYFINPSVLFNGNRVAFTTIIDREVC